jgi:hypothetical protein
MTGGISLHYLWIVSGKRAKGDKLMKGNWMRSEPQSRKERQVNIEFLCALCAIAVRKFLPATESSMRSEYFRAFRIRLSRPK